MSFQSSFQPLPSTTVRFFAMGSSRSVSKRFSCAEVLSSSLSAPIRFQCAEVLSRPRFSQRLLFPDGTRSLQPQEYIRQCRVVQRHEHVPQGLRAHDEGTDGVGSIHDKDQGGRSTRRKHHHVCAKHFHCYEVLFLPSFTSKEASEFRDTSLQSKMKCDVYIRTKSYANAVLSSGTPVFQWTKRFRQVELFVQPVSLARRQRIP